ncbi:MULTISPECIES: UDP-N-acetylmuramoyl-L-alanine--D-glutamate ligase [unclassified Streptomyces]|uniref:UDP-N-acetylmuramoyl-L-alanine--D-glutamate ligase n=1 Tax=unclassified Streptomyces TaxID=2593676 RepID=UPI0022587765|nr:MULTISPECIES: UDP-N-acetylmuramoyl-L-alanine--D-glutamate ligase [unclassified Streptomyces]WSP59964.1 UDP-N-acetylmuramoyl-L-alanine--D-glutamate ligase [Streptomyces sp. NBC_01241]WSU26623.1 UDP-N-acetylmuramoyl-L-alanine--D-glutamate ligase [Streptomyces sp. NBC_01108]MCX4786137.1 UDP-N-acetylmuramoyl-L-alanine--D-glutamate ligase [Streptomyces sp. NBC_01221]MCX4798006.1 UDP-N-acetylmuramoyl-L-alanine--D-glutamate ligase [Streptomyces sp. NBC_01242]WSJ41218.1 UDP-N-acetylmuramoyl-L-alani
MSNQDWQGKHVTVAGLGVSGIPAATVLHGLGAVVTVVNDGDDERSRTQAAELEAQGITVRLGDGATLPESTELIVTTPGWKPDKPLFTAAAEAGVPVWGDVELAWRLRGHGGREPAPWLAVTGTNGKTTTVRMLAAILEAAGLRTAAVGNIGVSLLDAVLGDEEYDVLAVELSSYQLHWAPSLRAHSAAVLNLAPDHLDWHGSMEAYVADKGRIYEGNRVACVYNAAEKATEDLVRAADVEEGCRAIGFTLGTPGPSQLGVVDGILVDRAFVTNRQKQAQELAEVTDVNPPAPHNIANALAAAALARAFGVEPAAVRDGLRAFCPDPHRIEHVEDIDQVAYIDDSKATNTHAAEASLAAYDPIVWIAGGLAKGATFDELVTGAAGRLRGVVLIGRDRALIREALARHAPEVPVVDLDRTDTGAMSEAVREAARLARPGDTVLMAPACASMDMFANYNKRGEAFADAVRALAAESA